MQYSDEYSTFLKKVSAKNHGQKSDEDPFSYPECLYFPFNGKKEYENDSHGAGKASQY